MMVKSEEVMGSFRYGKDADPASPKTKLLSIWAKFYGEGDGTRNYFPSYNEVLHSPLVYVW